jgi:hypothetical protein
MARLPHGSSMKQNQGDEESSKEAALIDWIDLI